MKPRRTILWGNRRGVAAVEFAIVLPLLMLLVCGTIEFGLLFYNKQVLTNASREGVRAGIVNGTTLGGMQQIVLDYCSDRLINLNGANALSADDVVIAGPDGDGDLSVTVSYDYDFLFAQIIGLGQQITVSAFTVMRMEP
jgi:Flp pilus assembly protein TadG